MMRDRTFIGAMLSGLKRFARGRQGNVSAVLALMMVPMLGALGMGAEASTWFLTHRALQNAADNAVLAAAANGCAATDACHTVSLKPSYDDEAKSVSSKMGFTHNTGDVTVTASNTAACPGGGSTCYSVTITKKVPVYLLRLVGFNGDVTASSGAAAQSVAGTAVATLGAGTGYCITALGTASNAIRFNGASVLDLTGCDLASNGGASCNAHTGDTIRYATVMNVGDGKNCGTEKLASTAFTDSFASRASNIASPTSACPGGFPQAARSGPDKNVVDGGHTLSTPASISGSRCGDVKLGGNITVTADSTLTIYNGRLDLNGFTLSTASGAHLTIVLAGQTLSSGGLNPDHIIMSSVNGGGVDFAAPTSSTSPWQGIAIYQAPNLTGSKNNVNFTVSGSNPQFNITGMVYAPNAVVDINGAINHATAGDACIAFTVKELQIAGTGSLFAYPTRQCDRAGLSNLPKVADKPTLVA